MSLHGPTTVLDPLFPAGFMGSMGNSLLISYNRINKDHHCQQVFINIIIIIIFQIQHLRKVGRLSRRQIHILLDAIKSCLRLSSSPAQEHSK